ncbi:zinc-binding alcohol dehydrogenase domain-containing protein [Pseudohyphozyma bogoriensis]|nr:zinc-binding alcohol dehydrogenase domain-containing protein [Pseudohyphozyma bogoriensis]
MPTRNETLVFNAVPKGYPVPGETLKKVVETINLDAPLPQGSVLLKTLALSLDPYQRQLMIAPSSGAYMEGFALGNPIANLGVAVVLRSENPDFKPGQHVVSYLQFKEYQILTGDDLKQSGLQATHIIDDTIDIPLSYWVGAAGMTGETAWIGLEHIAKPRPGETIFISGAAGAVGQMVGAFCKRKGLKVMGSAGSDQKVEYLRKELGFDVAWNYKTENTLEILKQHPFEIYWDNVGGETLDAVFDTIKTFGRIVACGEISGYNGERYGIKNTIQMADKCLHYQGFLWDKFDHTAFRQVVPQLIAAGEVRVLEHRTKGFDNGESFLDLMQGRNYGKAVIVFDE